MVNQFESMIRSGRINKISGKIAEWANLKPIVSIDQEGRGIVLTKCFSSSAARNKLVTLLSQKLRAPEHILEDYCIVHADENNQAVHLSHKTQEAFNKTPLFIESVSLSIGLHAGRGCIALAARIGDKEI
jgi:fatty acid-binding protein DegV